MAATNNREFEVGFAKLQGEDFEYYMQTYSIILGRNTKDTTVDVDFSILDGGMSISRYHARIFYDFQHRCFGLEIISKKGCLIKGVRHHPEDSPVKLDSQDLLQMGDKKFYFLLPVRNILAGLSVPRHNLNSSSVPQVATPARPMIGSSREKIRAPDDFEAPEEDENDEERKEEDGFDEDEEHGGASKELRKQIKNKKLGYGAEKAGSSRPLLASAETKSGQSKSRPSRDADNHQLLLLEGNDVISSVATVLSDHCGLGQWMPMEKLHAKMVEQYGDIWHHSKVRRYLKSEERPKERPWSGLLELLRKYPQYFLINTKSKGRVSSEFVCLVSLVS